MDGVEDRGKTLQICGEEGVGKVSNGVGKVEELKVGEGAAIEKSTTGGRSRKPFGSGGFSQFKQRTRRPWSRPRPVGRLGKDPNGPALEPA